jgi:hypothetical protein
VQRRFELFSSATGDHPTAGNLLEGSAFGGLPFFKQIVDSHQLELVCISVKEALGFECTH